MGTTGVLVVAEEGVTRRRSPGLGRGLSALLGEAPIGSPGGDGVRSLPIADIDPNPDQPRHQFDEEAMAELAESIMARGVLQPIVVRSHKGRYQIVAGERRWRAAQRAQLHEIPAIIREFGDADTFEIALIENIQRADLNPIEEGEGYRRLIDLYGHSQESLARIVHKSRSHLANMMRLTELPEPVRAALADGRLSMGHGRALITAAQPELLAEQVMARGLSVRETEKLAKAARDEPGDDRAPMARRGRAEKGFDADIDLLTRHLGDLLGLKVVITHKDGCGTVTLNYASLEQLDLICQRLTGEAI